MQASRSLSLFLTIIAFLPLHPKFAFAGSGYENFVMSPAQSNSLDSRAHAQCLDQSGGVTVIMNECLDAEYERLDRRLNVSYRAALRRLTPTKMRALRSDERGWLATRDEACLADFKEERDNGGTMYSMVIRDCFLTELKRRIAWIETRR